MSLVTLGHVPGMPGVRSKLTGGNHRIVFKGPWERLNPGGAVIDGAESRDPDNTGDVNVLRPGLIMGKITSGGKYAPSILGIAGEALDGAETELTVAAGVVTELVRRVGSSGTFKLTGPDVAAGTVRTQTITYSGATGTTITITAPGTASVWTLTPISGTDGGTFKLKVTLPDGSYETTAAITFSATGATFQSNIDTALEALTILPDTAVTVSSVDTTGVSTITWLSSLGAVQMEVVEDRLTDGSVFLGQAQMVETTPGVNGEFIAGSYIQPTDGSETPITLIPDGFGMLVTSYDGDTDLDTPFPEFPVGGLIDASQIINWSSDTSLQAWLYAQLKAAGNFVLDHQF